MSLGALNHHAEAIACHQKAIALDPGLAEAHGRLGETLRTLGRVKESRQALEWAAALQPQRTDLFHSLGESKHFLPNDPHLAAMEKLDEQSLSVEQPIFLHFGLGKAYVDLGRHKDAFRHLLEGNRLQRQRINYDEKATIGLLQRTANVFTAELMAVKPQPGDPSAVPIFIVGMPRSGSTLIEQMLASHPKVFGADEITAFQDIVADLEGPAGRQKWDAPENIAAMTGEQLRGVGAEYVRQLQVGPNRRTHHQQGAWQLPSHRSDSSNVAQCPYHSRLP